MHRDRSGILPIATGNEIDTVFSLDNIYFVEDSPLLTASSRMVLPAYINSLKRFRGRQLKVIGYCNSQGPALSESDPLFKLSVERAKLIYDYLIDAGFDPKKLSYKGLGNSKLKRLRPATPDQMRENMRVEIEVSSTQDQRGL